MKYLTEHELRKRLDNEFTDVDLTIHKCATKGVVATVYFYEKKLDWVQEWEDKWLIKEY